jgi:hypothetical protein
MSIDGHDMTDDVISFVRQRLLDTVDLDEAGAVAQEDLWRFLADDVLALTPCQCEELQGIWYEYSRNFWLVAKDVLSGAIATERHRQQLLVKMQAENDDKILAQEFTDIVLNLLKRIDWDRETIPGSQWCEIETPSLAIGSYWYCKRDGSVQWLRPQIENETLLPRIEDYIATLCRSLDTEGTKQIHQDVLWGELSKSALALNAVQVQDVQRGWWEHTQQFWETATQITAELQEEELLELKSKLSIEASEFILLQEFALVLPQLLTQITCNGALHEDRWCEIPLDGVCGKVPLPSFWFDKKSGQSSWSPPVGLMATAAVPTATHLLQSAYALDLLESASVMDANKQEAVAVTAATAAAAEAVGVGEFELFYSHRFGAGFRPTPLKPEATQEEQEQEQEQDKDEDERQDGVIVIRLAPMGATAYLQEGEVASADGDTAYSEAMQQSGLAEGEGEVDEIIEREIVCEEIIERIVFELQTQWQRGQQAEDINQMRSQIMLLETFDEVAEALQIELAQSTKDGAASQSKQVESGTDGETQLRPEGGQEGGGGSTQREGERAIVAAGTGKDDGPRKRARVRRRWQMTGTDDTSPLETAVSVPLSLPIMVRERRCATNVIAQHKRDALIDAVMWREEDVKQLDELQILMERKRAEVQRQKEERAQFIAKCGAADACGVGLLAVLDISRLIEAMDVQVRDAELKRLQKVLAAAAEVSWHAADVTQSSYDECRGWVAVARERHSCAVAASVALHAGVQASAIATVAYIAFHKARAARAARWAASAAMDAYTLSSMLVVQSEAAAVKAATKEAAGFASEMAKQALALAQKSAGQAWEAANAVTAAAAALGAAHACEAAARFTRMAMEYAFKCANPHSLKIEMTEDGKAERRAGVELEIVVQALDGYGKCMSLPCSYRLNPVLIASIHRPPVCRPDERLRSRALC